jgi:hypothetical protein
MPEIKARIASMLTRYESEVLELGEPLEETSEARVSAWFGLDFVMIDLIICI